MQIILFADYGILNFGGRGQGNSVVKVFSNVKSTCQDRQPEPVSVSPENMFDEFRQAQGKLANTIEDAEINSG